MNFIEKIDFVYDFAEVMFEACEIQIPYIDIYEKMEYNGNKKGENDV